ncbi:MAG: hypothetical protein HC897_13280 [Thermoanaerobaculia bacterium]|nr:hypothetical protein [Thermoanaerobaculia bacterium]
MTNKEKDFDAVRMMRELREAVGKKLEGKSFAEQRRWIEEQLRSGRHVEASIAEARG